MKKSARSKEVERSAEGGRRDQAAEPGQRLRRAVGRALPMIGVYDVFSATLAARRFEGLFLSGFGFAASHYGLPDLGFIAWPDMLSFVERLRAVLPRHHLLVDIDDGYGDSTIAAHVARRMELAGASGVVLEDQRRPRRCGHYEGKQLLEIPEYLDKLEQVLAARRDLFVVARTDAQEPEDVARRARAFAEAGADAVLVEAVRDLRTFVELSRRVKAPLVCNQIAGGKTPAWSFAELARARVGMVIFSTPCLFPAQQAIERSLERLERDGGRLSAARGEVRLPHCTDVLYENLGRRSSS